ncbi:MAG: methyltransferase domain-containing protein, partial [Bacteroidota bacterium]
MFEVRSNQPELMDDLSLSGDALRKNLDELEVINRYLGGNDVVTDALKRLVRNAPNWPEKTISVADLGSGGGDLLRLMARWFRHRNLHAELTGVDANAFMITYAQEKSAAFSEIHYRQEDIFSEAFAREQYDIVCCSLFCHHFTDDALIDLFARMQRQARVAVIINDLHRHWLAYHSIRFLT